MDYRSPPFTGAWENPVGMGVKQKKKVAKKKDSQKGRRSASKHPTISFINKPLSNFDLLNWVKKTGNKTFQRCL